MSKYYQVKVELLINSDTGKTKKFPFLVEAFSPTDAEARITEFLSKEGESKFAVIDTVQSKIREVIKSGDELNELSDKDDDVIISEDGDYTVYKKTGKIRYKTPKK